ncbi:alpha/beta hydrolase [Rathayibacter sp. CAU 1779]
MKTTTAAARSAPTTAAGEADATARTTARDLSAERLNRAHWEAVARGEPTSWEELGTEPVGVAAERAEHPSGLRLTPAATSARGPRPGRAGASAGPASSRVESRTGSDAVILAIHGGGFVSGSASTHRRMFGHLAVASGVPIFAVEYGLVPEHRFPSQADTVFAAYRELIASGAQRSPGQARRSRGHEHPSRVGRQRSRDHARRPGLRRIAVVGDSCGATLAIGLAARARDEGLPMPAGLLLLSAWTDFEATGGSYATGSDPFFTRDVVRALAADYLAGRDPRDAAAAPLFTDLHRFPPTYLQVGAEESLMDDSTRLAERMREAGVQTRLDAYDGQLHTFQMTAGRTMVADDAIAEAATWLRSILNV